MIQNIQTLQLSYAIDQVQFYPMKHQISTSFDFSILQIQQKSIAVLNMQPYTYKVRIIVSAQVELKYVHKIILLYRPQEKLNIWKIKVLSSHFINKILILENNIISQQFEKLKRSSLVVMMLFYYTAPVHNDMEDLDYY
ncbi:Hypothetical_protein [Hexamita inflata]|uniref:Hypothetical_protein n=1 Tax=Hexamita inflata TaxID=28002 RepID=A0AA86Q2E4_9EUKA|nr:Hypothetical protein HINF_LOCUS38540 [Hexamita inflata]CAI9950898.1 Hypothetical protein HINF_LOCUS38543 [Hexamita inflata]CAI9950900.1 Hypothetical protein HINF_LOCUS38545 [Hexamita inflata]